MTKEALIEEPLEPLQGLQAAFDEVLPTIQHTLKPEDDLIDLGVGSIAALEIAAALDLRYGVHCPEEQLAELRTVGDFVALLERLLTERDAAQS